MLEFPAFILIGVYCPANRDETRDEFRVGFLEALDVRVRNLVTEGKQVILTGDMNVVCSEKDTSNLAERLRKEGLTAEDFFSAPSRRLFNHLLYEGRVFGPRDSDKDPILWDLCRIFHQDREGMFTCWDTKKNTRPANVGSRIDYVFCSNGIKDWFIDANIQEGLMGSDHCPVFAVSSENVIHNGAHAHLLDLMNPKGMFHDGKRLREWSNKDLLPSSARLIPEFDKRRSIKDMFMKKAPPAKSGSTTHSTLKAGQSSSSITSDDGRDAASSSSTTAPPTPQKLPETRETLRNNHAFSGSTPIDPPIKRPAEASPTKPSTRANKRLRPAQTQMPMLTKTASGQSTLNAFFQPKSVSNSPKPAAMLGRTIANVETEAEDASAPILTTAARLQGSAAPALVVDEELPEDKTEESDRVFDPIENKESWSKLLGKRVLPRCEHGETCISLVAKKAGVNYGKRPPALHIPNRRTNVFIPFTKTRKHWLTCSSPSLFFLQGRSFFICPRPLGPSGEKEKGTQWRCGTFIWSSDWKESRA